MTRLSLVAGAIGLLGGAAAVGATERLRLGLATTCVVAALLIGCAAWLLLVEADDDGGNAELPDEPEWWPQFERDLDEWTRLRRVPTVVRR